MGHAAPTMSRFADTKMHTKGSYTGLLLSQKTSLNSPLLTAFPTAFIFHDSENDSDPTSFCNSLCSRDALRDRFARTIVLTNICVFDGKSIKPCFYGKLAGAVPFLRCWSSHIYVKSTAPATETHLIRVRTDEINVCFSKTYLNSMVSFSYKNNVEMKHFCTHSTFGKKISRFLSSLSV